MLFLNFFVDGDYWSDLVHLPSMPAGVSYIHEFRYEEGLVHSELFQKLEKPATSAIFNGKPAIIGCRFLSRDTDKILPIRSAKIIQVDFSGRIPKFYFEVGRLFDFCSIAALSDGVVTIPPHLVQPLSGTLAFEADMKPGLAPADCDACEDAAWGRLVDLISSENALPINQKAKNSIFLRVRNPVKMRNGARAPLKKIRSSWSSADTYGYQVVEAVDYELTVDYIIPSLIGKSTTIGDFSLTVATPVKQVELSSSKLPAVGNYGAVRLSFRAAAPTQEFKLEIVPPVSSKSQDGQHEINGRSIYVPIRSKLNLWHRFTSRVVPGIILIISFMGLSLIGIFDKAVSSLLKGEIVLSDIVALWPLLLLVAVVSAVATFAIHSLKS